MVDELRKPLAVLVQYAQFTILLISTGCVPSKHRIELLSPPPPHPSSEFIELLHVLWEESIFACCLWSMILPLRWIFLLKVLKIKTVPYFWNELWWFSQFLAFCGSKSYSESLPWVYSTLEKIDHWLQSTKQSRNINLIWFSKQFLEIVSVFKEAAETL